MAERNVRTDVDDVMEKHVSLSSDMAKSSAYVGRHLEGLNDKQMASVAGLIMMTRVATLNERMDYLSGTQLSREFWDVLPEICPPLPSDIESRLPGCMGLELSYAESVASCMNSRCERAGLDTEKCEAMKDKYQDECEKEHGGKLGAAVNCHMAQIEKLKEQLQDLQLGPMPPQPFPWPY